MSLKSKVKQKTIHAQGREIIGSLLDFMRQEAAQGAPIIPFAKVQERVAAATGVSLRTIQTIAQEKKKIDKGQSSTFVSPKKSLTIKIEK